MSEYLAFSRPGYFNENEDRFVDGCEGMTLRDYFAGQALVGILANTNVVKTLSDGEGDVGPFASRYAFKVADAMLEARKP